MRSSRILFVLAVGGVVGCNDGTGATAEKTPGKDTPAKKLAGVYPDKFQCESILSLDQLGAVLDGTPHVIDSASSVPRGIAHPCTYEVTHAGAAEYWTYDFDCRDNAKQRADKLFEQYKTGSTDMIEQYDALADAGGIKPNDAGVAVTRPDPPIEVDVGAKGLDHHGQGLVFIDDDAPCYVRIVGPEAARRLALAQTIAKNLTFANAPMTPRAFP
ncbi:MAG TPA: hypothetical protein VGC41_23385 [Kofleriaceae bacterium]